MNNEAARHKALAAEFQPADGEREVVAVVSSDCVDRDREVVVPKGLDFAEFRANPVIPFCHDIKGMPVGRCLWIKADERRVLAKVKFADTDRGRECHQLYKEGVLNAFSIGFIPLEMGPPTREEIRSHPEWKGAANIIRRAKLFELSVVPVPANQEALAIAVSKGVTMPDWIEGAEGAEIEAKAAKPGDAKPEPHLQLKAGHYVEWGKGMSGGCGKVVSIHKAGKVPGVAEDVECSDDNPGAKVKCYTKAADSDKWRPTDKMMGHSCKNLSRVAHPLDDEDGDEGGDDAPRTDEGAEPKPKPKAAALLPPLPPHRTKAQVDAAIASRLTHAFDGHLAGKAAADAALDAAYGAV